MKALMLFFLSACLSISIAFAQDNGTTERRQGSKGPTRTMLVPCKSDKEKAFDKEVKDIIKKAKESPNKNAVSKFVGWNIVISIKDKESSVESITLRAAQKNGKELVLISKKLRKESPTSSIESDEAWNIFENFFKLSNLTVEKNTISALDSCKVGICSLEKSRFWSDKRFLDRKKEKKYTVTVISPEGRSKEIVLHNSIGAALLNATTKNLDTKDRWTRNSKSFCLVKGGCTEDEKPKLSLLSKTVSVKEKTDTAELYRSFVSGLEKQITRFAPAKSEK